MTPLALDTSVAVPLMLADHPQHDLVERHVRGRPIALPEHAELETLAVLTRLPGDLRTDRVSVMRVLTSGFRSTLVPHHGQDSAAVRIALLGIEGGAVWDALVAIAAVDNGAVLASRDERALPTYARVGATVELVV